MQISLVTLFLLACIPMMFAWSSVIGYIKQRLEFKMWRIRDGFAAKISSGEIKNENAWQILELWTNGIKEDALSSYIMYVLRIDPFANMIKKMR